MLDDGAGSMVGAGGRGKVLSSELESGSKLRRTGAPEFQNVQFPASPLESKGSPWA